MRLQTAMTNTGFWEEFNSDWACLDCELMPWSVKAQELIKNQYAAVGASAKVSLNSAVELLSLAAARGVDVGNNLTDYQQKKQIVDRYVDSYRRYCWQVHSLEDIKIAPFHLLATEREIHINKNHLWHLEKLAKICQGDEKIMQITNYRLVDLNEEESKTNAIDWWQEITDAGSEGIVVKPLDFVAKSSKGIIQPALKCRGREYLRIIYGAEYTLPENLERLRQRGLSHKRSLAMREFCLGIEALERFVNYQPLRRVHECVFGILALESEPIDPRL